MGELGGAVHGRRGGRNRAAVHQRGQGGQRQAHEGHQAGRELLASARPTHDEALSAALDQARRTPELAELADSLHGVPRRTPASVGS